MTTPTADVEVNKIEIGDTIVHDSGEHIRITTKVTNLETGAVHLGGSAPETICPTGRWSATYHNPQWIEKILVKNE